MTFCKKCNSEIDEEAVICIQCGFNQASEEQLQISKPPKKPARKPKPAKEKFKHTKALTAGIVALLILISGGSVLYFRSPINVTYTMDSSYKEFSPPLSFPFTNRNITKTLESELEAAGVNFNDSFKNKFHLKVKFFYNIPKIQINRVKQEFYYGTTSLRAELTVTYDGKTILKRNYNTPMPANINVSTLTTEDGLRKALFKHCHAEYAKNFKDVAQKISVLLLTQETIADELGAPLTPPSKEIYLESIKYNNDLLLSNLSDDYLQIALSIQARTTGSGNYRAHWTRILSQHLQKTEVQEEFLKRYNENQRYTYDNFLEQVSDQPGILEFLIDVYVKDKIKKNFPADALSEAFKAKNELDRHKFLFNLDTGIPPEKFNYIYRRSFANNLKLGDQEFLDLMISMDSLEKIKRLTNTFTLETSKKRYNIYDQWLAAQKLSKEEVLPIFCRLKVGERTGKAEISKKNKEIINKHYDALNFDPSEELKKRIVFLNSEHIKGMGIAISEEGLILTRMANISVVHPTSLDIPIRNAEETSRFSTSNFTIVEKSKDWCILKVDLPSELSNYKIISSEKTPGSNELCWYMTLTPEGDLKVIRTVVFENNNQRKLLLLDETSLYSANHHTGFVFNKDGKLAAFTSAYNDFNLFTKEEVFAEKAKQRFKIKQPFFNEYHLNRVQNEKLDSNIFRQMVQSVNNSYYYYDKSIRLTTLAKAYSHFDKNEEAVKLLKLIAATYDTPSTSFFETYLQQLSHLYEKYSLYDELDIVLDKHLKLNSNSNYAANLKIKRMVQNSNTADEVKPYLDTALKKHKKYVYEAYKTYADKFSKDEEFRKYLKANFGRTLTPFEARYAYLPEEKEGYDFLFGYLEKKFNEKYPEKYKEAYKYLNEILEIRGEKETAFRLNMAMHAIYKVRTPYPEGHLLTKTCYFTVSNYSIFRSLASLNTFITKHDKEFENKQILEEYEKKYPYLTNQDLWDDALTPVPGKVKVTTYYACAYIYLCMKHFYKCKDPQSKEAQAYLSKALFALDFQFHRLVIKTVTKTGTSISSRGGFFSTETTNFYKKLNEELKQLQVK